jgi:hypothetical protein
MKTTLTFLSIISLLTFAGCSRTVEPTAEDISVARQAIPISEVLLMVRSGYRESNVLKEIKTRHVPEKIDGTTEEKFRHSGASANVIAALKSEENTLTEAQKIAFDRQQQEKAAKAQQSAQARQNETYAQQQEAAQELNRRQYLQQQTIQNVQRAQASQVSYDIAQKNYEYQRKNLELTITSLEAELNRRRRYGAREVDLTVDYQRLEDYKKQLHDLTPPLR